jgi:hypothetical protein
MENIQGKTVADGYYIVRPKMAELLLKMSTLFSLSLFPKQYRIATVYVAFRL